MTDPLPDPGWYPDPSGDSISERWWTGRAWTTDFRDPSHVPLASLPFNELPPRKEGDGTTAQMTLALSPLCCAFFSVFLYAFSMASPAAGVVLNLFLVAFAIWVIAQAFNDRRELVARGIPSISPLWVLLTPLVYLALRFHATRFVPGASRLALVLIAIQCAIAALASLIFVGVLSGVNELNELR